MRKELIEAEEAHICYMADFYKSAISNQIGDKLGNNSTVEQKLDAIIEYMQTHQSVSVSEIASILSIKTSRTRDYLRMLVERRK